MAALERVFRPDHLRHYSNCFKWPHWQQENDEPEQERLVASGPGGEAANRTPSATSERLRSEVLQDTKYRAVMCKG
eukprot:1724389-Prymnesium_polylepis.1